MLEATIDAKQKVGNLLDFSKQDLRQGKEGSDFKTAILKALVLLEPEINKFNIDLRVMPLPEGLELEISENAFCQVLLEVCQNAIEALEADVESPQIKMLLELEDENLILSIIDNGTGISEQEMPKVFTPLFSTKNPSFHKGLGLTTCKHILQDAQSKIEVLPNEGRGTRVRMTLSRKNAPA
jgi:C4-dicarboxylate-specific signal transduction histidine kinase